MSQSNSRVTKQEKKRKSNRFLNIATGVVLILIVIVSVAIFTGGGDVERADEPELSEAEQAAQRLAENSGDAEAGDSEEQEDQTDSASLTEAEKKKAEEEKAAEEKEKQEQEEKAEEEKKKEAESEEQSGNSSNSEASEGDWKPIGTQQEDDGNHVSSYDEGSVDWQEKLDAISYASGIPVEEMTVWFLGNHQGDPKQSVGTVSDSSTPNKQVRVYLQWVDNEGWMPTKLEEL